MYKDEKNVPPLRRRSCGRKPTATSLHTARSRAAMIVPATTASIPTPAKSAWSIIPRTSVPMYCYKSGNKEIWQCKHFTEKGSAGCTSPILQINNNVHWSLFKSLQKTTSTEYYPKGSCPMDHF